MTSYGATPGILSEDITRPWGERLKEWRTTRGLSVEQLATALRINKSQIQAWERGDRLPADEQTYVVRLRELQEQAGETPGQDTKDWVAAQWKTFLRGT
jgi:ribosome-binding protein aMBF1 (putative translation factor)